MYKKGLKRIVDFSIAIVLLIILFPVFFGVYLMLIISQNSAFFTQHRPGKNSEIFKLIKFKTMNDKRDENGKLLPDAVRLTPVGKFIRSTSLDELPQLINVLKGDMSLIGPRPLLVKYLPLYSERQVRRHEVKPGITGWAQVNGRNTINWEQKFEYDIWYVDNISFLLDIKILWLTLRKVLVREGISSNSSVTMEPFEGNK
ncbi:sugar transferase [Flavobacterium sp.]|uniref:sugar transferase n=1 Tax=Flavobacterium sp. TaxID=239 RepID=UPI0040482E41